MIFYEKFFEKKGFKSICGIDEAGRGSLVGCVVAAACVLEKDLLFLDTIKDSKKLSSKKRDEIYLFLKNSDKCSFATAFVDEKVIDEKNILNATLIAMKMALDKLDKKVDFVLIDGNFSPKLNIPKKEIIKGDNLSISIAAASIIAKKERDDYMKKLHQIYPNYGFIENMGYGTKKHIEAIAKYGPCPLHRKSFEPIKSYLKNRK